ncbi:MAG: sulfotransferase [Candidatus Aminicenantes bacterium]|nr:sulfotransferase [Candidatus Aminicenantes bacterium]
MDKVLFKGIDLPQDPVFVVGYPRSGTTLVQSLLATQEDVYSLPETHFYNVIYREAVRTDEQGFLDESCLPRVFAKIHEKMDFRFDPGEENHITRLAQEKRLDPKLLFEFIVGHFIAADLENRKERKSKSFRWVEKTPNHAYFLEHILSVYPQAQFVNIIRHPVPAVYSRKINFPFNKDKPLEKLAQLWKRSIFETEEFARQQPGKLYSVKYESLTANVEAEFGKICNFVGIALNMDLVRNHPEVSGRFILSAEVWKKKEEYKDIVNTNTKYLDIVPREEAEYIESLLADKMKEYGYAPLFS